MPSEWDRERIDDFLAVDESGFSEIEPGLRSGRPVTRLSLPDKRCVHGYYTMSPLSADGTKITYFEFDDPHPDRGSGKAITGRVIAANADGSDPLTVMDGVNGSVCQGSMQQWLGPTRRIGWTDRDGYWIVRDSESGEEWRGDGFGREFSPEGTDLFIQTPEQIHLLAEAEGRSLAPEEVAARIIDFQSQEEKARISVADVLEVHPEADEARKQHMCFKQTLFSPDGKRISFNFSNAWYTRHGKQEPWRHEKLIANRDGTDILCLGQGASHPGWHPSGDYYSAIAPDEDGVSRFMLYPVDGSTPKALGADWLAGGHPSFQPGEARYLAVDYPKPAQGHVLLRLYDLVELTYEDLLVADYTDYSNDSGTHFHPAWSPDGKSIYISSAHADVAGFYRVDL